MGHSNLVEHTVDTKNAKPIKQPPRQVPIAYAEGGHKALEKLHAQGVIHPSTSPWSSLIALVWKKSGQLHPCVDYQQLNKVTRDVAYHIPRTQDCIYVVSSATMFSTMDITSAYNQVPVAEQDILKTAFLTKYGLYDFTKMHLIELTLSNPQWSLCFIYLDDIIVFSHDFEEQIDRLDKVLT